MIDKEILDVLVCPEDHSPLSLAGEDLLERLNAAIAAGRVENREGTKVEAALHGGLVRQDGKLLYPIVDDIPVLLVEEAISLEQIDG